MKNKKGFFWLIPLIFSIIAIIIIALLIVWAVKISAVLLEIIDFLKVFWWLIQVSILLLFYGDHIFAIIKALLNKIGIKV